MVKYRYSLDTIALFAAFCIFLSTVEYLIPKPFPFFRLGLANLPILISLIIFKPKDIVLLIILKIFGQGLITGTLFSYIFLFSAAGAMASGTIMILLILLFKSSITLIGVSISGALASNLIQILFAKIFIFGNSVKYIAPPLLVMGFISALILGLLADKFINRSKWL
ncbi:MAG: Gx transporter family protein, partial [Spirochaetales bacterium]|nr:Gx transporter family protein [Spirochaetales bacterium]